jgi:hypothetical protein
MRPQSNAGRPARGVAEAVFAPIEAEMRAFDRLPPEVQEALRQASFPFSSITTVELVGNVGAAAAVARIQALDRQAAQVNPMTADCKAEALRRLERERTA